MANDPVDDSLLTLDDVALGYDRHVVLQGVNFSLKRGTFTALLGANGSGKSTLIKTILGIIPPLAGRIHRKEPVLGYVPQREKLDSIFPVSSFDVVLMGVYGRAAPGRPLPEADRDWARRCLAECGAADFERQPFSQLSGGQKQRVLIARALATRPDFLLLDEPTAGIDPGATRSIMELLGKIHRERAITMLMVNHDLPIVRRYAERVLWIHERKILQGTTADLLSRERMEELLKLQAF